MKNKVAKNIVIVSTTITTIIGIGCILQKSRQAIKKQKKAKIMEENITKQNQNPEKPNYILINNMYKELTTDQTGFEELDRKYYILSK